MQAQLSICRYRWGIVVALHADCADGGRMAGDAAGVGPALC
jgi:hypothetical protein